MKSLILFCCFTFSSSQANNSRRKSVRSFTLSRLSVKDDGGALHLSKAQVNTLQEVAGEHQREGREPSAMDKYLAMKTQQDIDNIGKYAEMKRND